MSITLGRARENVNPPLPYVGEGVYIGSRFARSACVWIVDIVHFMYKSKRSDARIQNGSVRDEIGTERNLLHGLRPRYLYTNPGLPSPSHSLVR